MDVGHRGSYWAMLFVVAAALSGLLAMHGFEAAFVHIDHAGSAGHVEGADISPAEYHVQHGMCSLEKPDGQVAEPPLECVSAWSIDPTPAMTPTVWDGLWNLANRAVLTAFSILRL